MSENLDQIRARLAAEREANEEFAHRLDELAHELNKEVQEHEKVKHVLPPSLSIAARHLRDDDTRSSNQGPSRAP